MSQNGSLLSVNNLSTHFRAEEGVVRAVDGVSLDINAASTFALVGESGCGKSVTALSIMRLIPSPQGRIVSGQVFFEGNDLLAVSEKKMRRVRGNQIAMVFQEPMTSLNPVYTVGNQIVESIVLHQGAGRRQAITEAEAILEKVGIAQGRRCLWQYPHQLSGGMCQRVMIAMAVSCRPALLIADEPTTALDVTIQAQILDLLDTLQAADRMGILLITHDLGIVAERADHVAVMYAGRIVEVSQSQALFGRPMHPYTVGLLESLPQLQKSVGRLKTVPGSVPDPLKLPPGCRFHPRCPIGSGDRRCQTAEPALEEIQPGRHAACWYAGEHINY